MMKQKFLAFALLCGGLLNPLIQAAEVVAPAAAPTAPPAESAMAATPPPAMTAAEAAAKRARSAELRTRAKALRDEADTVQKKEAAECKRSLLVNNCLLDARDRRLEKIEEARRIEVEQAALDRELRRYDAAERRAKRAKRLEQAGPPTTVTVEGESPSTLSAEDLFNAPSSVPPKVPKKLQ